MRTPAAVLADLLRSDAARPRVTFYEDTPGPTSGERVELSARVLANWVSKAANALQDEWDVAPGSLVRLDLPPHWRALYWALAVWSVGGCVVVAGEDAGAPGDRGQETAGDTDVDLLVTDDPARSAAAGVPAVLVTLAALARSAPDAVAAGVVDEARELATYADQFAAWEEPSPTDPALRVGGEAAAYDAVVPDPAWPAQTRLHLRTVSLAEALTSALAVWAVDGSLVLARGPVPADGEQARIDAEGVTRQA
jgi:uncharacterized protein (TIGR03089 family)